MALKDAVLKYDPAYALIPAHIYESLEAYLEYGHPPGDFLQAVLCNDLMRAVSHADEEAAASLAVLARLIHNRLPGNSWGSMTKMMTWMDSVHERIQHGTPA